MTAESEASQQARSRAIEKVSRALGLWADVDGTMFLVESNGELKFTRHIATDDDLRKAQSYAVFLMQTIEALERQVESLQAKEVGRLGISNGLTAREPYDIRQEAS